MESAGRLLLASRALVYAASCLFLSGVLISFRNAGDMKIGNMLSVADVKRILLDVFGIRISFMVLDRKQTMITNAILLGSFLSLCYVSFYQYDESIQDLVLRIWVTLCIKISSYLIKILSGQLLDLFLVLYPSTLIACSIYWPDYKVLGLVSLINFLLDSATYFRNLLRFQWKTSSQLKRSSTKENTFDVKIPLEASIPLSEMWKVEMGTHISHLSPIRWDKQSLIEHEGLTRRNYLILSFESEELQESAHRYLISKSVPFCKASLVTDKERAEYIALVKYPAIADSITRILCSLTQSKVELELYVSRIQIHCWYLIHLDA